jgi:S-methylmethionine-dependent homocysteine/selenocysteine methylase
METSLIFNDGIDLPHFASFVLLATAEGWDKLKAYYRPYLAAARAHGAGFVLDSATWRANPDWGDKLGYNADALRTINLASIDLLKELRAEWETGSMPCVISGAIGPRGDGYKAGHMDAREAEDYHRPQITTFADSPADMVTAFTLSTVDEAIGIVRAARSVRMPCAISFTVETDGRLAGGLGLREAIEATDDATEASPVYYMVNCAHPTHFEGALQADQSWVLRIRGIRANASARSHAELDESDTLDPGDPDDLAKRYQRLRQSFPGIRILGGCCGTDHRHVTAMAKACLPFTAPAV